MPPGFVCLLQWYRRCHRIMGFWGSFFRTASVLWIVGKARGFVIISLWRLRERIFICNLFYYCADWEEFKNLDLFARLVNTVCYLGKYKRSRGECMRRLRRKTMTYLDRMSRNCLGSCYHMLHLRKLNQDFLLVHRQRSVDSFSCWRNLRDLAFRVSFDVKVAETETTVSQHTWHCESLLLFLDSSDINDNRTTRENS